MAVAIMQPYFFPYLGYFQLVQAADHFVLYDDVKFIKKGWINRNRISNHNRIFWIRVPIHKLSQNKTIRETLIAWDAGFSSKLIVQLHSSYKKAPYFNQVIGIVENVIYKKPSNLAEFAGESVISVFEYLGIKKNIYYSSQLEDCEKCGRVERLISITNYFNDSTYINPINGKNLYDKNVFAEHNIDLRFLLPELPEYSDNSRKRFIPGLSIIDILMWNDVQSVRDMLTCYTLD
jgi:hypothetical protein